VNCYRRNIKNGAWNKLAALAVAVDYIDLGIHLHTSSGIPANKLLFICEAFVVSRLCVRVYEYAGVKQAKKISFIIISKARRVCRHTQYFK
jgi:hypothetical protein